MANASAGRPVLVLMPGMDGTGDLFEPLINSLQPRWRCVVTRYPTDVFETYEALTERVLAALPAKPCVLVAESFSGPIAVAVAAQRPEQVRAVVLVASFLRTPVRGWRRWLTPFVRLAMRFKPPRMVVRLALVERSAPRRLVDAVLDAIGRVKGRVMARRLDAILAVDVTTMAAQVRVPVLYLQARGDRLVGADALADARAVFPTFQEARLDGPHLLLQRYPARAADCIDAFCATVESQNSGMT